MSHLIKALCLDVLSAQGSLKSNSPSHILPRTQSSRSSQDPNTNSTQGVSYHIPN